MKNYIKKKIEIFLSSLFNLLYPIGKLKLFLIGKFLTKNSTGYLITKGSYSSCIFLLNNGDHGVARRIYIGLDDEYLKTKKAISIIRKIKDVDKLTLLDIGANIGHITIPLLNERLINSAYLWEPVHENRKLLFCNLLLNDMLEKVEVFDCALGNQPGKTFFELSEDNYGDHRVRVTDNDGVYEESKRKVVECEIKSLDSFIDRIESNNIFLWIDVQGYEGHVLGGAKNILSSKPFIGLEFWPYALERTSGIDLLVSSLSKYNGWYDLSYSNPDLRQISDLISIYQNNLNNDLFSMDILLVD